MSIYISQTESFKIKAVCLLNLISECKCKDTINSMKKYTSLFLISIFNKLELYKSTNFSIELCL